jgi:GMP synthase-like glutamine amidotransferase
VKCFGLCLGAQLLAEVLGGHVVLQKDWELGFTTVTEHVDAAKAWIRHCTERLRPEHSGNVQSKEQMLASLAHDRPDLQRWYFNQLDRFFLPTPK